MTDWPLSGAARALIRDLLAAVDQIQPGAAQPAAWRVDYDFHGVECSEVSQHKPTVEEFMRNRSETATRIDNIRIRPLYLCAEAAEARLQALQHAMTAVQAWFKEMDDPDGPLDREGLPVDLSGHMQRIERLRNAAKSAVAASLTQPGAAKVDGWSNERIATALLSDLYRLLDAGGLSHGRSLQSDLLEPALALMNRHRPSGDMNEWPSRREVIAMAKERLRELTQPGAASSKCEICGEVTTGPNMLRCPKHYQKSSPWTD